MGKYSRDKGARGERLFAALCHEEGYCDVARTAQRMGKAGNAPDVIGLPHIHAEVKFVERLNVRDAMEQAQWDAMGSDNIPIVAHKKCNAPWLITMDAVDWFRLYREFEAGQALKGTAHEK